jgi:hypothetical protein
VPSQFAKGHRHRNEQTATAMKPPKGPFWAWNDLSDGAKWHLCTMGMPEEVGGPPMMRYLMDGFEDYWYDDDWEEHEIVLVPVPKALE